MRHGGAEGEVRDELAVDHVRSGSVRSGVGERPVSRRASRSCGEDGAIWIGCDRTGTERRSELLLSSRLRWPCPACRVLLDLRLQFGVAAVGTGAAWSRRRVLARNGDLSVEIPVPLGVGAHASSVATVDDTERSRLYAGAGVTSYRCRGRRRTARDADGRGVFVDGGRRARWSTSRSRAKKDFATVASSRSSSGRRAAAVVRIDCNGCGGCDRRTPARRRTRRQGRRSAGLAARIGVRPRPGRASVHRGGAVSLFGYQTTTGSSAARWRGWRTGAGLNDVVEVDDTVRSRRPTLPTAVGDRGRRRGRTTPRTSVATAASWRSGQEVPARCSWGAVARSTSASGRGSPSVLPADDRGGRRDRSSSRARRRPNCCCCGHCRRPRGCRQSRHAVDADGGDGLFVVTAETWSRRNDVTVIESSKSGCLDAEHNLPDDGERRSRRGHRLDAADGDGPIHRDASSPTPLVPVWASRAWRLLRPAPAYWCW